MMTALQRTSSGIAESLSRLSIQWSAVAEIWNDAARLDFETQFWQPYEPALRAALEQIEQIGQAVDQAMSELED